MLGPVDYAVWFITVAVEIIAVACLFKAKAFSRHFTICLYLCFSLAIDIGRFSILGTLGYSSGAYYYFYYYSDSLITLCLYVVLMALYAHIFSDLEIGKYLRVGAMLLLAGTIGISYYLVSASSDRMVTRFAMELSRNLYFVGILLTYVLWAAMIKMKENRTRLMQLVLALGVYFSAFSASFALANLYPQSEVWRYVSHLTAIWLPISWAYTFVKIPEDARMTTARVLVPSTNR